MAQPVLECVQGVIERHIIPLPGVNRIVAYVGKAVDDVGTEEGVDGVWEAAPTPPPPPGTGTSWCSSRSACMQHLRRRPRLSQGPSG